MIEVPRPTRPEDAARYRAKGWWKDQTFAELLERRARDTPQRGFLSILNPGDGRALLDYKGVVSHSRWAWRLKDWVDRRFMARYQELI